jgi:hypothetical protein
LALAVVRDHLHASCGEGVEQAVLAGGAGVVAGTGQRVGGPDQPAGGVGEDLDVDAVALVLSGVIRPVSA